MPPLTANASKATSTEQPAEPFILREIDQQSDSEIDELEGYASPPLPPSSLSIDNPAAQEPLLEMTMDDDVPLGMHLKPSSFLSVATQPWEESHKATLGITSPSSLPLTPPDVVITASDESLVSVPKEQNAITPRSRNELPIQPPIYSRFENDEAFGYVFNYFGGDSSRIEVSSDSEGDSDRMSPLRRRDVLIISENKSRRKPKISKDAKQRIMAELEPELLFSSADSGTSAGSDKRRPSPVNLLRPTKKNRARKVRLRSTLCAANLRSLICFSTLV